jgi:hypothetical protein
LTSTSTGPLPSDRNRASQFRSGPPYPIGGKKYAADFNEIKALGGIGEPTTPSQRTEEQTQIGLFWIESSPLSWNRLTRSLSAPKGLDPWENARLFGLLNLAMADGYIPSWEAKYHYNLWAAGHRDSRRRHRRQSGHCRRSELDATAAHLPDAGSRLRARRPREEWPPRS